MLEGKRIPKLGKTVLSGTAVLSLLLGLGVAQAPDAEAKPKVTLLKVGKTVKLDINGGAKEQLAVESYTDEEYGAPGVRLRINGKVVLSEVNLPSDWEFAVTDFITADSYKEVLACQYPSDVSNIRCQIYRWKSGKLVEAKYKATVPYSWGSSVPSHVDSGWALTSLAPTGKGTFTGHWGDGTGATHAIKLKLNSKFEVVNAPSAKQVTAKTPVVKFKPGGEPYKELYTTDGYGNTVTPYATWMCETPSVTFKVIPGTWKPSGVKLSYQWYYKGKKIKGATKSTYKTTTHGSYSVKVTGKKSGYKSVSKTTSFQISELAGACM
jgi:hypothetical protein